MTQQYRVAAGGRTWFVDADSLGDAFEHFTANILEPIEMKAVAEVNPAQQILPETTTWIETPIQLPRTLPGWAADNAEADTEQHIQQLLAKGWIAPSDGGYALTAVGKAAMRRGRAGSIPGDEPLPVTSDRARARPSIKKKKHRKA